MKVNQPSTNKSLLLDMVPEEAPATNYLCPPIAQLKKILVPIDFSDCSRHALNYALAFASHFGAEITLLAVVEDVHTSFEYGNPEFMELQEKRRKRYEGELAKIAIKQPPGIMAKIVVKTGKPFEEIVKFARESEQDLIVLSTRGLGGRGRAELGSTAERVIRYATCPALVVRPREHEFVYGEFPK